MSVPSSQVGSGLVLETSAPMFAASAGLRVVQWNDAAEGLVGLTRSQALGRPCHEVLGCPEARRRAACAACFEVQLPARSGEAIWVGVVTMLAAAGTGAPVRVHVLRELTPQKRLEDLLRQVVSAASETYLAPSGARGGGGAPPPVTAREREVIRLLARGGSTGAIAATLGVTARTARNHIQNVLCKLRVHSRVELVAWASSHGMV